MVLFQIPGLVLQIKGVYCYLVRTYYLITKFLEPIKCLWTSNFKISKSKKHCITLYNFFQKSAKKKFNSVLTYVLTYVSEYSQYGLSDSITHTHGFSRLMLLTLLILTGFHGPCYSRYSYSRGSESSPTHTHSYSLTRREFSNPAVDDLKKEKEDVMYPTYSIRNNLFI